MPMKCKLKENTGLARLIWVLVIAIVLLLCIILIPAFGKVLETGYEKKDLNHEQTAWDSAFLRFNAEQKGFDSIYDYEGKTWVDEPHGVHIEGYGESHRNKGKVIHVICDEYGQMTLEWVDPLRYRATE